MKTFSGFTALRAAAAVALSVSFALPTLAFAAAPKAGDPAPAVSTTDVKGRKVEVPQTGKTILVALVSKATGDKEAAITKEIHIAYPDVQVYTFIDVSGYMGWMHGIVKGKISTRHDEAVKDDLEAFKKAGKVAPADFDQQVHLVPDFDGKWIKTAYGATDTDKEVHRVIVGADGKVAVNFEKTPTLADVKAALDKASAAPATK
jgi:hypothetical protein